VPSSDQTELPKLLNPEPDEGRELKRSGMTPEPVTLSRRFLATYNKLDDYMRARLKRKLGAGHVALIEDLAKIEPLVQHFQRRLEAFAKLRNSIVHDSLPDADPIAEPHERIVEEYETILKLLLHPPEALKVAVNIDEIFTTDWEQCVVDVVATMNANVYTHVPILRDGAVVGVFSENTICSYLAGRRRAVIDPNTRIGEFRDYVPLAKHASEVFEFLPQGATVADVLLQFQHSIRDKKRLATIFITADGQPTGRLLGLVTAWDLAKPDFPLDADKVVEDRAGADAAG
jgi:CBS domain-containing protein